MRAAVGEIAEAAGAAHIDSMRQRAVEASASRPIRTRRPTRRRRLIGVDAASLAVQRLKDALSLHPALSVLLISDTPVNSSRMAIYLESGIKAVVSKQQSIQELIKTLFYIRSGQVYLGNWQSTRDRADDALTAYQALSGREREVARLMSQRVAVRDIAEELGVSCKTVHSYKDRIFVKLGFERLPELILFMQRHHQRALP